jgi:putative membrane protein
MKKLDSNFISLFLKGLAIGTAAIIPGISGGTIAFMLGIYDSLIESIVNIKKNFKQSIKILIPTGLGIVIAIGALTFPMGLALEYAPLPTVALFAGFIVGSLPTLRRALPKRFSTKDWIYVFIPALIALLLGVFSVVGELDASVILEGNALLPKLILIVVGFLGVSAFVVPGISGSMLLLTIGFYEPVLNSLQRLIENVVNIEGLVPEVINFALLGIGALVGFIVISLLMSLLFKKYKHEIHLAIYGFIVGSIGAIFYNYKIVPVYVDLNFIMVLISFVTLLIGVVVSYVLNQRYAAR